MSEMNSTCPVCSAASRSRADRNGRIYHICTGCGFTCLDRTFLLSPAEEKKRYDLHNNNPEDEGYRKWLSDFADQAVSPFLEAGGAVLDFGSGPQPVLASILGERGYAVQIYDKYFSPQPVSGSFDLITATEVLEHIADPLAVLGHMKSKLNRRGYLAFKTSFRPVSDEEFFRWWYREDSTHISFFTVRSFEVLAEKMDLNIEYCDNKSVIIFRI